MPYWRCYYHLYWATKERRPVLGEAVRERIHGALARLAEERRIHVHAVGGIEDHVHMVVSIPPAESIGDAMGYLKGRSSSMARHEMGLDEFEWQGGYGVLTFGKDALPRVVGYVKRQEQHHAEGTLFAGLERHEE